MNLSVASGEFFNLEETENLRQFSPEASCLHRNFSFPPFYHHEFSSVACFLVKRAPCIEIQFSPTTIHIKNIGENSEDIKIDFDMMKRKRTISECILCCVLGSCLVFQSLPKEKEECFFLFRTFLLASFGHLFTWKCRKFCCTARSRAVYKRFSHDTP